MNNENLLTQEKSLVELVIEVVEKYNSYKSLETESTVMFKNKTEPTEVLTQVEFLAACEAGKSASDYEPAVVTINPSEELKNLIFNGTAIFKDPYELGTILMAFEKACQSAIGSNPPKYPPKFLKSYETYDASLPVAPAKKEKSAFAKAIAAINAKIYQAKTSADLNEHMPDLQKEVEKLRLERVKLYIREGVTPRASFKDLDLYLSEKAKTVGTISDSVLNKLFGFPKVAPAEAPAPEAN